MSLVEVVACRFHGAESCACPETDRESLLVVSCQANGKTPHELVREAEARAEEWKRIAVMATAALQNGHSSSCEGDSVVWGSISTMSGESRKALLWFSRYLALGPSRSLRRLQQQFGKPPTYLRQLASWSKKYRWVERAKSWDGRYDTHPGVWAYVAGYFEASAVVESKRPGKVVRFSEGRRPGILVLKYISRLLESEGIEHSMRHYFGGVILVLKGKAAERFLRIVEPFLVQQTSEARPRRKT